MSNSSIQILKDPDFISTWDMQNYRRAAKAHRKDHNVELNVAYEEIAQKAGFPNWHKLILKQKDCGPTECFFKNNVVLAFDEKDAPSEEEINHGSDSAQKLLIRDDMLQFPAYRSLSHAYFNNHHLNGDYTLPPSHFRVSEEQSLEMNDVSLWYAWYRVNVDVGVDTSPLDVLKHIRSILVLPPQYLAIRGIFYGVHNEGGNFAW